MVKVKSIALFLGILLKVTIYGTLFFLVLAVIPQKTIAFLLMTILINYLKEIRFLIVNSFNLQ